MTIRPKKFLGQHFLRDQNIARKIIESLSLQGEPRKVLEIGPGMGVLTQYLVMLKGIDLYVIEIDKESVIYLKEKFPQLKDHLIEGDFLEMDVPSVFRAPFSIIGNFPYNISSQILFKILEHRNLVAEVVCMLQKEVADRISSQHGNKTYGILSVLLQTYYSIEFLFKVSPGVFHPQPKVMSGVIRLTRNERVSLPCDENLFTRVVKQGFNNRRKTLRNALKNLNLPPAISTRAMLDKRAEQLSVEEFIQLTLIIEQHRVTGV
ncbi:MAG TPA: 16S rRNA (adenine(1518)-N(6)/adenine(1519)-N(6))-dimethyltransferase RsmA [Cyclobacteriaceae bacterium]|nr:16S rRNA (adenine(1518)-N(6)/adenine(1519)-N(6))-dimethyltransferase RsmA [Cyclobacteriaceae bacterium]